MIRLTYAKRFVTKAQAESEMQAYSLRTLDGRIVPEGNRFRIVIDAVRPDGVQRYLKLQMPGAKWTVEEIMQDWTP